MKLVPNGKRVLVAPETKQEKVGALYLPDEAKVDTGIAKVVAVGPAVVALKRGDKVLLPRFGGAELKMDGKTLRLIDEDDILGKLED